MLFICFVAQGLFLFFFKLLIEFQIYLIFNSYPVSVPGANPRYHFAFRCHKPLLSSVTISQPFPIFHNLDSFEEVVSHVPQFRFV